MKILIDAHIFDDKFQGTRTYLKGLYEALIPVAKDWEFFFVANDVENLEKEFGKHSNVHYIQYKSSNKYYRLLVDLPKIIKANKIDFAHYQYISPFIKNCKTIITTHDILFKENRFKKYFPLKYRLINGFLFKISAKKADVLLTVSEYSKEKISQFYNLPLKEIYVTPNAVSDDFVCNNKGSILKRYKLGKYILYVSRVEPRKNHIALLKAYTELKLWEQGYKLVFIGVEDIVSEELENYKQKFQKEFTENVLWLEGIPYDELKCFYQDCELFVFPSFAEGFGIPPLEALAMNKKVLCSNATAMQDFNFPESLSFSPKNIEELTEKLSDILTKNIDCSVLNTELNSRYNWNNIANNFYQLINANNE
ncbi:MAG: glycosyltransferase family 1 protein [Vicingaceae bacterium]|nr:glycosyltransferase family 1 protein [Vicingaceae bacterium]